MTASNGIRLLTIDLDDTLWPCAPTIRRAESRLYAWLERAAPRLTEAHDPNSLRRHRRDMMQARPEIAHDLTLVRRDSLRELLAAFEYEERLADDAMALFLDHRNRVEPYADVIPTLRGLAAKYRLVSITNGNSDVKRTPLRGLFHHSLTAAGVGAARPDPALFLGALDWAGIPADQALHVGDDPRLDVQTARRVGMAAVWVNRDGSSWPQELAPPDAEVADLIELDLWLKAGAHAL